MEKTTTHSKAKIEIIRNPAQDIHDRVAQPLVLLKQSFFKLAEVFDRVENMSTDEMKLLKHCQNCIDQAINESRKLISEYDMEEQKNNDSQKPTVEMAELVNYARNILQMDLNLKGQENLSSMPTMWQSLAYTWVQELVTNAAKHADVHQVDVQFQPMGSCFQIEVKDQGKGFDLSEIQSNKEHFGLQYLKRNISRFGGKFEVESSANKGSSVRISLPYVALKGEEE